MSTPPTRKQIEDAMAFVENMELDAEHMQLRQSIMLDLIFRPEGWRDMVRWKLEELVDFRENRAKFMVTFGRTVVGRKAYLKERRKLRRGR